MGLMSTTPGSAWTMTFGLAFQPQVEALADPDGLGHIAGAGPVERRAKIAIFPFRNTGLTLAEPLDRRSFQKDHLQRRAERPKPWS